MKTIYFILSLVVLATTSHSQSIGLKDIVQQPAKEFSADVKADQRGGSISFDRVYRSNCTGNYLISWQFDKDLSSLKNGEEFTITLSCENCQTPCGYKWKIANVFDANNVTGITQFPDYSYNHNIKRVNTTAGSFGIHDWSPGHLSHSYTFKYENLKRAKLTSFVFDFAGHRVYYVFEEGLSATKAANCHTLFGLGKLVNSLEIGAYEGYGWDWMDKTIGYALEHIKASNCLDNTYLSDLKKRMYNAPNTKVFLNEIRAYSKALDSDIKTSCMCCSP